MNRKFYKYDFDRKVPMREVENSLLLAVLAVECLYGRSGIRNDAVFELHLKKRSCVIDAATDIGGSIARIFTGFLCQEFGEEVFKVKRVGNGNLYRQSQAKTPV